VAEAKACTSQVFDNHQYCQIYGKSGPAYSGTDPGYRECAAQYLRGYFDAETGVMLNGKLRPARSGKRINETSFLRIDESVAGTSAAE
jgi:hypothetical protein